MLGGVLDAFIEAAPLAQHISAHQNAVELDELGGLAAQVVGDLGNMAPRETVALNTPPPSIHVFEMRDAPGHVDDVPPAEMLDVQRTHQRRFRLSGAVQQRLEPPRANEHVVLDEDDVGRLDLAESDVAQLGIRNEVRNANQLEALLACVLFQIRSKTAGRMAVDVDQLERLRGVAVETLERDFGATEPLPWNDHHRHRRLHWHRPILSVGTLHGKAAGIRAGSMRGCDPRLMTNGALSLAHGVIRRLEPRRLVDSARRSPAGSSTRTDTSSQLQYLDQGYLGPVRVLSPAECRGLVVWANATSRHPPLDWSKGHGASSRIFYELASHPTIVAIVTALLGGDVMLWGASIESRRAGEVHPWHTDIESAASEGTALSVWIGLQHTSRDSALTLVPYSHRFGATVQEVRHRHGKRRADATADDIAGWAHHLSPRASVLQPDMVDGEALVFDGRLWHGSFNGSGRTRRAVLLQYATPDTPIRIPDFNYLDWPFRLLHTPRPACVMISGRGDPANNRIVPAPLPDATLTTTRLSNRIYPLRVPLDIEEGTRWKPYHVFRGATANVADLTCHASVLIHGHSPHPPHRHEEEEILILLSGEADLLLPDRRMRLKAGQLVYYPAQFAHTLEATSNAPASYLMFKWRNVAAAGTDSLLTFRHARPFEDAPDSTVREGLSVRGLFQGPTTWLHRLECHVSTMPPGGGYEPHVDAHDVAIVLLDGQVETLGERVGARAVIFHPAGEAHGLRNPGDIDARYLVIEFHGPHTAHLAQASVGGVLFSRLTDPERWKRKIKHVWRRLRHDAI